MSINDIAAHNLLGRTLSNNWIVSKKVEPGDGSTGGFFSVCYIVEKENDQALFYPHFFRPQLVVS